MERSPAKSSKMLLRSTHAVSISGWVPVDGAAELEKRIKGTTDNYYLEYQEVTEKELADVPILLETHVGSSLEDLFRMYSCRNMTS